MCDSFWSEGAVEVWRSRPAQAGQAAEAVCVGAVWPGLDEANTAKKKRPSCCAEERWTNLSWERMGPEGHSFSWLEPEKHCIPETGRTVSLQTAEDPWGQRQTALLHIWEQLCPVRNIQIPFLLKVFPSWSDLRRSLKFVGIISVLRSDVLDTPRMPVGMIILHLSLYMSVCGSVQSYTYETLGSSPKIYRIITLS